MKGQVYIIIKNFLSQLESGKVKAFAFNDWENLILADLIKLTKAGQPWKCGKNAYRLDWEEKCRYKCFLIHGKPCLLLNRFKQDGKWYLTYFDAKEIITETQDSAKYNKKVNKNATREKLSLAQPRTFTFKYQLCLPAPMELIDRLVEEADSILKAKRQKILDNKTNYTKAGKLSAKAQKLLNGFKLWEEPKPLQDSIAHLPKEIQATMLKKAEPIDERIFKSKVNHVIAVAMNNGKVKYFKNALIKGYHPDTNQEPDAEIKMQIINKIIGMI